MKGKIKIKLIHVLIVLAVLFLLYKSGNLPFATVPVGGAFENCLWAPDYCWASCQINLYQSPTQSVPPNEVVQCSLSADVGYCIINNFYSSPTVPGLTCIDKAIIYSSCKKEWYGWTCTGQIATFSPGSSGDTTRFNRGQWIKYEATGNCNRDLTIKTYKQELRRCGTAACGPGSGEIISNADGCSWNPGIDGYKWEDGTSTAREIPLGQSYPFVCSQHLLSCPSPCTSDLACAVPSQSLKTFKILYNGKTYNAYVANSLTNIIGCKKSIQYGCIKYDEGTNKCLEYGDVETSSCGTIAVWSVGDCALNSDCGRPDYVCKFDTTTGTGDCVPEGTIEQECTYPYECTQSGSKCYDKTLSTPSCVNNKCTTDKESVECCFGYDCQSGYYCENYECKKSQTVLNDCQYECCINFKDTKDKACIGSNTFCCPLETDFAGTCKQNMEACTSYAPGPGGLFDLSKILEGIKKAFNLPGLFGAMADLMAWVILAVIVFLALWILSKLFRRRGVSGVGGPTIIIAK